DLRRGSFGNSLLHFLHRVSLLRNRLQHRVQLRRTSVPICNRQRWQLGMRLEDAHLLERRRDRSLQLHLLALIRLPRRKEHHEERKQQRDEVGVRNQPALMPRTALVPSPVAPAISHRASATVAAFFASKRKDRSLISIVRGFIPS